MNAFSKYLLYRKLIKSNPSTSTQIAMPMGESLRRVDWQYDDGTHTYLIKSYYDPVGQICWADVVLNDKLIMMFSNRRAADLFDKAWAVRAKKLGHAKRTIFMITR